MLEACVGMCTLYGFCAIFRDLRKLYIWFTTEGKF